MSEHIKKYMRYRDWCTVSRICSDMNGGGHDYADVLRTLKTMLAAGEVAYNPARLCWRLKES